MKIIFLIPPSEGKIGGGNPGNEKLSFECSKPLEIAMNATQKDLKCTGTRYEEGIELNKNIESSLLLPAISRYTGIMYKAIDYVGMDVHAKKYFSENFYILSGMYGLLQPHDEIGNYKLPIETKGLSKFWKSQITDTLNNLEADIIIDLLPHSYKKMIDWKEVNSKILKIVFYKTGKIDFSEQQLHHADQIMEHKKLTHGVKGVKGEFIKNICERGFIDIPDFGEEKQKILNIYV